MTKRQILEVLKRDELIAAVEDREQGTTAAAELAHCLTAQRSKFDQPGVESVVAFADEPTEALSDWLVESRHHWNSAVSSRADSARAAGWAREALPNPATYRCRGRRRGWPGTKTRIYFDRCRQD